MTFLSVLSGLAMLSSLASVQPAIGLSGKAPIDVSAARCEVFEVENKIDCTGSVRVTQDDSMLTADRMQIFRASSGDGFKKIESDGNVRYAAGLNAVSGDYALYDGETTIITIIGDVVVVQGDQVMVGGKLVYNTTTKAMIFTPGADGRVRGVFNTQSKTN